MAYPIMLKFRMDKKYNLEMGIVGKIVTTIIFYGALFGIIQIADQNTSLNFIAYFAATIFLYRHVYNPKFNEREERAYQESLAAETAAMRPYFKPLLYIFIGGVLCNIFMYVLAPVSAFKFLISSIALFAIFTLIIYSKAARGSQKRGWCDFAYAHNFLYSPHGDVQGLPPALHSLQTHTGNPTMTNVLTGTLSNHALRMYTYTYRWAKKAQNSVLITEWTLPPSRPSMCILSNVGGFSETIRVSNTFTGTMTVLEGNFSQHFSVYVEPGSEAHVREILQPDVMVHLLDELSEYNFLFIDDHVYIIADSVPFSLLPEMLERIKTIFLKIEQTLIRMD